MIFVDPIVNAYRADHTCVYISESNALPEEDGKVRRKGLPLGVPELVRIVADPAFTLYP